MTRSKRRERDQQHRIDQLSRRVHGDDERRTCGYCGRQAWVRADSPTMVHRGIDGRERVYGICPDDEHLHDGGSYAVVVAERLDIDPTAEALAYVTVPSFAASPGARVDRPNTVAWAHVTDRELAELVESAARQLAETTVSPCRMCGDVRRTDGAGHNADGWCASCDWRLNRGLLRGDVARQRDVVATVLVGLDPEVGVVRRGIGDRVGIRFFHELPADEQHGERSCFAWHDDAELASWHLRLFPPPPQPGPPPPPRQVYPYGGGPLMTLPPKVITPRPRPDPIAAAASFRARW